MEPDNKQKGGLGPSSEALLERAYGLKTPEDTKSLYRDWATTYDQHLESGLGYRGPEKIAELLSQYLNGRDARILDVGCGTGLAGGALAKRGCSNIDGLDFSPEMLTVAGRKAIYRELIEADLEQPLDIETGSYDAAICCGTFTHGHVGPEALGEIFRVLKSNAPFACTIHSHLWISSGFERALLGFQALGQIEIAKVSDEAYFEGQGRDGKFCLFIKTA